MLDRQAVRNNPFQIRAWHIQVDRPLLFVEGKESYACIDRLHVANRLFVMWTAAFFDDIHGTIAEMAL